jgi:hypothetical protein
LLTHAEVKKRQTNRGTKQSISRLKKHVSQGKLQPPLKSQAKSKQQQEAKSKTPRFISSRSSIQEAKPSTRKNKNKRQKIQDQREGIHKA